VVAALDEAGRRAALGVAEEGEARLPRKPVDDSRIAARSPLLPGLRPYPANSDLADSASSRFLLRAVWHDAAESLLLAEALFTPFSVDAACADFAGAAFAKGSAETATAASISAAPSQVPSESAPPISPHREPFRAPAAFPIVHNLALAVPFRGASGPSPSSRACRLEGPIRRASPSIHRKPPNGIATILTSPSPFLPSSPDMQSWPLRPYARK